MKFIEIFRGIYLDNKNYYHIKTKNANVVAKIKEKEENDIHLTDGINLELRCGAWSIEPYVRNLKAVIKLEEIESIYKDGYSIYKLEEREGECW